MRSTLTCIFWITVISWLLHSYKSNAQEIAVNGQTTIRIVYEGVLKTTPVTAQVYHVFPAYDLSEVSDSLSAGEGQIWLRLPVRATQEGYLSVGDDELKCMLIPGDTVHLRITMSAMRSHYSYEGASKPVQTYLLAKREQFSGDINRQGMNAGVNAPNLIRFKQRIDSLTQVENHFWTQYKRQHSLPAWFARFESDAIRYNDAMLRLYMTWYQTDYQKKKQSIPTGYFNFLSQLPVRNIQAQYDYAYLNFLREFVGWKFRSSKTTNTNEAFEYEVANQTLGNDLAGFFRLWKISYGVQDNPERARTELKKTVFPAQYHYLVSYLQERSGKRLAFLKPGDKAPNFLLTDTRDSLVSLSQFKGQAVYLCFWFATCGGCRIEFPHENRLVDQFKGKPVKIVSICTSTKPNKWRQTIREMGLKTINLFANESWQKTLTEKYAISVYPHYVLIGPDGHIVENFATRPSQNVAPKIESVLTQMSER